MIDEGFAYFLGLAIVGTPIALLLVLMLCFIIDRPLSEPVTNRAVGLTVLTGLISCVGLMVVLSHHGAWHFTLDLGDWLKIEEYHFSVKLLFDSLSLPFGLLAFLLSGTIGVFANRYLHRETGYDRFFLLYGLFIAGITLTAFAGTIETLFAGWEMVGLSSALLVAFFHDRAMPVRNGLWVWTIYRVSDAAFLTAAIVLHHMTGKGDFDDLLGGGPWPEARALLSQPQALILGLLLLAAAAGKSALLPFSGWLPRAMEGPTPSSAVFYGAISVHLGAFLLLRVGPILAVSSFLSGAVAALGLITAAFAVLAGRVQTDIKSALSFASLTQVGLIVTEIGLGFSYVALAHIIGHACLRTLQFLRAPTLLHDYHAIENAIGARLPRERTFGQGIVPESIRAWWYRFALERGYLDACLTDYVAHPLLRLLQKCDAAERRWTDFLSGSHSREPNRSSSTSGTLDELS